MKREWPTLLPMPGVIFVLLITIVFLLTPAIIPNSPNQLIQREGPLGRILSDEDEMGVQELRQMRRRVRQGEKQGPSKDSSQRVFRLIPFQDDVPVVMAYPPTPNQLYENENQEEPEVFDVDIMDQSTESRDEPTNQIEQIIRGDIRLQHCNHQHLSLDRFQASNTLQTTHLRANLAAILLLKLNLDHCLKDLGSININSYPAFQRHRAESFIQQISAKAEKEKAAATKIATDLKERLSEFQQRLFNARKIAFQQLKPIHHPIKRSLKFFTMVQTCDTIMTRIQSYFGDSEDEERRSMIRRLDGFLQELLRCKDQIEQKRQTATNQFFSGKEEKNYQLSAAELTLFKVQEFMDILFLVREQQQYQLLHTRAVAPDIDQTLVNLAEIEDQFTKIQNKLDLRKIEFIGKRISYQEFEQNLLNGLRQFKELISKIQGVKKIFHPRDERKQSFASLIFTNIVYEEKSQIKELSILRGTKGKINPKQQIPQPPQVHPQASFTPRSRKPPISPPEFQEAISRKLLTTLKTEVDTFQELMKSQTESSLNKGIRECLFLMDDLVGRVSGVLNNLELSYLQRYIRLLQIAKQLEQECIKQPYRSANNFIYPKLHMWDSVFATVNIKIQAIKANFFTPYSSLLRSGIYHSTKFTQDLISVDPQRSERFMEGDFEAKRIPKVKWINSYYHKLIPEFVLCDCFMSQMWEQLKIMVSKQPETMLLEQIPAQFVEMQRCLALILKLRLKIVTGVEMGLNRISELVLREIDLLEREVNRSESTLYAIYEQASRKLNYQMLSLHKIVLQPAETSWKVAKYLSQNQLIDNQDFLIIPDLVHCSSILETLKNQYAKYLLIKESTKYPQQAEDIASFLSQLIQCDKLLQSSLQNIQSSTIHLHKQTQIQEHVAVLKSYCKEAKKQFEDELVILKQHCFRNSLPFPKNEQKSYKPNMLEIFDDPKELERLGEPQKWGNHLTGSDQELKRCFNLAARVLRYIQRRPSNQERSIEAEDYFKAMQSCMDISQEAKLRSLRSARISIILEKNLIPLFVYLSRIAAGKPTHYKWGQHSRQVAREKQRERQRDQQRKKEKEKQGEKQIESLDQEKFQQKDFQPSAPNLSPPTFKSGQIDPSFHAAQKGAQTAPQSRPQPSPMKASERNIPRPPISASVLYFPIDQSPFSPIFKPFFQKGVFCLGFLLELYDKVKSYEASTQASSKSILLREIIELQPALKHCIREIDSERLINKQKLRQMSNPEEQRISRTVQLRLLLLLKRYDSQFKVDGQPWKEPPQLRSIKQLNTDLAYTLIQANVKMRILQPITDTKRLNRENHRLNYVTPMQIRVPTSVSSVPLVNSSDGFESREEQKYSSTAIRESFFASHLKTENKHAVKQEVKLTVKQEVKLAVKQEVKLAVKQEVKLAVKPTHRALTIRHQLLKVILTHLYTQYNCHPSLDINQLLRTSFTQDKLHKKNSNVLSSNNTYQIQFPLASHPSIIPLDFQDSASFFSMR